MVGWLVRARARPAPITKADLRSRDRWFRGRVTTYCDHSDQNPVSARESTRGVVRNARLEGLCGNKS
jgi:hypothetical protein